MKKKCFAAAVLLAALALTPTVDSFAASGWTSESGNWVYCDNDSNRHKDWIQTRNGYYYMDTASGVILKSFKKIDGRWYYLSSSGLMQTGWIRDEDKWYYYFEDDALVQENWLKVGENYFFVRGTGELVVGWRNTGGSWYYFRAGGRCTSKWVRISSDWFRMGTDGKMKVGWQQVEGIYCYFGQDGRIKTGWLSDGTNRYYMDPKSGKVVRNWKQINNAWMFFDADGHIMMGWIHVSGHYYYLGTDGKMIGNTTFTLNGVSYTFGGNGAYTGNESVLATEMNFYKEPKQEAETVGSDTKSGASNGKKGLPGDKTAGPDVKKNN